MTTPELEHTAPSANSQLDIHVLLRDKVCLAVQLMLNEIMDWELEAVIGAALYERSTTRRDYRIGHYERGLVTGVGPVRLTMQWVAENLYLFWPAANSAYVQQGRGAIIVDTTSRPTGEGHPFAYFPHLRWFPSEPVKLTLNAGSSKSGMRRRTDGGMSCPRLRACAPARST